MSNQKSYERMMHDLQVRTANFHMGLGKAMDWKGDCQSALSYYEQTIKNKTESLQSGS
jgi:hypothetical protein